MKTVNLFYLAKPRYGGWVSFTSHLMRSLLSQKYSARLFQIGKTVEKTRRSYGGSVSYMNVHLQAAKHLISKGDVSLITAVDKEGLNAAKHLLADGAGLVIHDPTELREHLVDLVKSLKIVPIVIRKSNIENLKALGIESHYIPHPYVRAEIPGTIKREWNAVALSRIDWDKNTHVIAEANRGLEKEDRVKIYGKENRMYAFNKLDSEFPEWKEDYFGTFPHGKTAAVELAAKSRMMVDLSTIKGDGGGTQYTFMEAFDGGAQLVLNRGWLKPDEELVDGENCIAVENAEELRAILREKRYDKKVVDGGYQILEDHGPGKIVAEYARFWG